MKIQEVLEIVSQTNPGMVRSHNEDSVAQNPVYGLVVLADGMGGYNAGEVASAMATSLISTEISRYLFNARPTDRDEDDEELAVVLLRNNIHKANASIFKASQHGQRYEGMGTTVVSALFYDNRVAVGHVGDSRLYRLRGGVLDVITHDHSLLQEQIDSGMISVADARKSRNKNMMTRAVGIDTNVVPEVHVHDVLVGDIYLLCSDGLNDMVEDEDIQHTLYAMQGNLPLAAEQLIQIANDNGGRDNVSVILVRVKGGFAEPKGWLAKLINWFQD